MKEHHVLTAESPRSSREDRERSLRELTLIDYELADRNFSQYLRSSWPVLNPTTEFKANWHHDCVAEYLTACYMGQIKRLIINEPPKALKSGEITIAWPTWYWAKKPEQRFMFTSYSSELSTEHSLKRRTLIESAWYQDRWGCHCSKERGHEPWCRGFRMQADQNVKTHFSNDKTGNMKATSMTGSATGMGGNILIVDDPHDPKRAESDTLREAAIQAFDLTFSTRLDDKKNGVIIIVMQRLHDKDLTGHCLAQGGYEHLILPAEAEAKTIIVFPVSKREVVREPGNLLHESREGRKELSQAKVQLGQYGYSGQYQQDPAPRTGGLLKRAWWQRYDKLTIPESFDFVIDDWDFAFKDLATSDWVCGQVWGLKGPNKYLLHMKYKPMGFIESMRAMTGFRPLFPKINESVVEDKANGPAIIQVLKTKISGIKEFNPQGSKTERAAAVTPQLEAGNVFLPVDELSMTWDVDESYLGKEMDENGNPKKSPVQAFIDSCAKFPKVEQDGDVDCLSMALLRLQELSNSNLTDFLTWE